VQKGILEKKKAAGSDPHWRRVCQKQKRVIVLGNGPRDVGPQGPENKVTRRVKIIEVSSGVRGEKYERAGIGKRTGNSNRHLSHVGCNEQHGSSRTKRRGDPRTERGRTWKVAVSERVWYRGG